MLNLTGVQATVGNTCSQSRLCGAAGLKVQSLYLLINNMKGASES